MSFALIFHDTDAAPGKGAMDVTHWILWNIPASATGVPASVPPDAAPGGIEQGKNIRGANGYQPPCPPVGARPHHYIFELYALDTKLDLPAGSGRADLLKALDGHVIGKASLVGIFGQGIDEKTSNNGVLPSLPVGTPANSRKKVRAAEHRRKKIWARCRRAARPDIGVHPAAGYPTMHSSKCSAPT